MWRLITSTHTRPGGGGISFRPTIRTSGRLYLIFAICAGLIGTMLSIIIRAELMEPGMHVFPLDFGDHVRRRLD